MGLRTVRWEAMDKDDILLSKLAEHYLITCRTEGKTASVTQVLVMTTRSGRISRNHHKTRRCGGAQHRPERVSRTNSSVIR